MTYSISDIEDQIIATLQAEFGSGFKIDTHAGEINARMFLDAQYMEGVIKMLPFILVKYNGRSLVEKPSSMRDYYEHKLQWTVYVGAESLRNKQESARSAYTYIGKVFDCLHGKFPKATGQHITTDANYLEGTQITTQGFQSISPLEEVEGQNERLVVDLPRIAVYSLFYEITLAAYSQSYWRQTEAGNTKITESSLVRITESN